MSRHPEVLWAQRSDRVYLTVSLPDAKDVSVKSEPQGLFSFSATGAQGEPFSFNLELYGSILPEGHEKKAFRILIELIDLQKNLDKLINKEDIKCSKTNIGLRNILCTLQKEKKGWWTRLLKSEEKPAPYIKVDWNRWCDEEETLEKDRCLSWKCYGSSKQTCLDKDILGQGGGVKKTDSLASDDDFNGDNGRDDDSSDDDGLLYLPDLEKARGN